MKFSEFFRLGKSQAEIDFVDINPSRDTGLYVDPFAIEIKRDQWSIECGDHIRSFFEEVLAALRKGHMSRATLLMSHLREPRDTFLGVSRGDPDGRGVGEFQAEQLIAALQRSVAFKTGLLEDLAEAELFIPGIGRDKISDLTTNIIRGPLIAYTQEQCELHGVPLRNSTPSGAIWNPSRAQWEQKYVGLPFIQSKKILLVPKYSVRWRLSLESQEFYNHYMINFLQSEYMNGTSSLVHVLKNGNRRVYKKDVKQRHPFGKDDLAKFVTEHPEILDFYKKLKGAQGALDNEDFDEEFDAALFSNSLIATLQSIPSGAKDASAYHSFIMGALTYIFYPDLIRPIKEKEVHQGRKRIDIVYTNAAIDGFFFQMQTAHQTRSLFVPVECKNYSDDIGNPELDQLARRFGHQRGFFGILACRSVSDMKTAVQRCRDTVNDGHGYILIFTDKEIIEMLKLIGQGNRAGINDMLRKAFADISH